jgi:hypothetical protein
MNPVFTLQWPEFLLAHRLQTLLPKKKGYSVFVPVSRQEKAVDLAILRKQGGAHKTITIQIKSSRTYSPRPPKRRDTKRYRFNTWFNRFEPPDDADFIILFGMYAPDSGRTKKVSAKWYCDCSLLFTKQEMKQLMKSCLTVGGKPDKMFGFGFDDTQAVYLTRGDMKRKQKDYADHVLEKRIKIIRESPNA